jgi:RNA polymerase sigma-70 factor (ECF subfamily)
MADGRLAATASDDELIQRVARREGDAFAALFRRHYPTVYRFALHVTGAAVQAEDVAQEVFMAVMRDAGRYEAGRSSVAAWLCGIARNHALRHLDRERRVVPLTERADGSEDRLSVTTDPVGELFQATRLEELRRAVLSLPLAYREVVVLCDLQEFSYADAAEAIGCAVGTVRSRLHRARALLVTKLAAARAGSSAAATRVRYPV